MSRIDDLLKRFGIQTSNLIGSGAEAQAFALSEHTVLRINREGAQHGDVSARIRLLSQIAVRSEHVDFEIPFVKDFGFEFGLHFTVENRLSGFPMSDALMQQNNSKRDVLVHDYLETSHQIANLLVGETVFGEMGLGERVSSPCFKSFLRQRAQKSLDVCMLRVDLDCILDAIADPVQPQLVHLDYCPSNVMYSGGKITGVLDFGGTTIAGSSAFNPVVATAFLDPAVTRGAQANDHRQALDWLADLGQAESHIAMTKWLAAYWSFCGNHDDLPLFQWCKRTLFG